jgi:hypothetical protein
MLFDFLASLNTLPEVYRRVVSVGIYILVISLYSLFVWKVYRLISKKDIIALNLRQYNSLEHPTIEKLWAGFLYFFEYIIILPFLILFWYIFFSITMILFSDGLSTEKILLLSAGVVGSIRVLAYCNHDIAAEVAKLIPMTILGLMLLSPGFFDISRITQAWNQISQLLLSVGYALIFVASLELILRFFDLFRRIIVTDDR